MSNRTFLFLTIITLLLIETVLSQVSSNWTWILGSDTTNQYGNYGTKGIISPSSVPGARVSALSWTDSNDNFWLFGGLGYNAANRGYLNDLWKFDGTNWTWISGSDLINQLGTYGTKGVASLSNIPGGRNRAATWTDSNNALWLFGGFGYATGNNGFLNDLWKFDGTNWTWISGSNSANQNGTYGTKGTASPSNVPGSRSGAVSWISNNDFWLFGGYGSDATGTQEQLNDLWKFDGTNWTWVLGSDLTNQLGTYGTKGIASPSNIPGARNGAVSWIENNNTLWLFGGYGYDSTTQGYLNDLWKFDGTNWVWISGSNSANRYGTYGTQGIASPSNVPGAHYTSVSWTDSNNNLWLFGGNGYDSTTQGSLNDLWKFDGTNWIWVLGSDIINQNGTYGTQGIASLSNVPGSRYGAVSWIDSNDKLWLFGGVGYDSSGNYGSLNDLWRYEFPPPIPTGSLTSNSLTSGSLTSNSLSTSTTTTIASTTSTTGDIEESGTSTIRITSILLIIVGMSVLIV